MHGRGEGAKSLVGANVGGRFFTANVLLASGESENEAAAAFEVCSLAGQASRHLADKFFTGGNYTDKRAAIARRETQALIFHRDDVSFGGGDAIARGKLLR